MRNTVDVLVASIALATLVGCGHPPRAEYPQLPTAVRRAVLDDFPECRARDIRGLEVSEQEYELRGCGWNVRYVCPGGARERGAECELVAPTFDAVEVTEEDATHAAAVATATARYEAEPLDEYLALTIGGAVLTGAGALTLLGSIFADDWSAQTQEAVLIGAAAGFGLGLVFTLTGVIGQFVTRALRGERLREITDECSAISFGAGPGLVGIAASLCFP